MKEPAIEIPLSVSVVPELERLTDLGSSPAEICFVARIGAAPVCHDVSRIFAGRGMAVPPDLKLYERFRLWLVPHRIALLRRKGFSEPVSVGLEIEYVSDGGTCSVVSLIPAPQFVQYGGLSLTSSIKGSMALSGELTPSPDTGGVTTGDYSEEVSGLGFHAKSSGAVSLAFSATVVTPFISAVGLGSSRAEWRFDRHEEALFGRDIETWAIVALPKRKKELRYKMRYNITTRTLFFPTRTESEWHEVACTLAS